MVKLNTRYIRQLLGNKGMSVADLAYRMGVSEGLVRRLLDKETVAADRAKRMAEVLGVPIIENTMAA